MEKDLDKLIEHIKEFCWEYNSKEQRCLYQISSMKKYDEIGNEEDKRAMQIIIKIDNIVEK